MAFYCNGKKAVCVEPKNCVDCRFFDGSAGKSVNNTNADRIRAMSDADLAWMFMEFRVDAYATANGNEGCLPDTQNGILI